MPTMACYSLILHFKHASWCINAEAIMRYDFRTLVSDVQKCCFEYIAISECMKNQDPVKNETKTKHNNNNKLKNNNTENMF